MMIQIFILVARGIHEGRTCRSAAPGAIGVRYRAEGGAPTAGCSLRTFARKKIMSYVVPMGFVIS
ncbi:MAG: hypothetical protein KKA22_09355 [Gammaproteobacteria bacterium]|nr:hypothetical protein [Gammaproteobacteria bacterium]MBU1408335.1 hypothetical protein [Gammaproteobacteria bacterium]